MIQKDNIGRYRASIPNNRLGAQMNLQWLMAKGLRRVGAEQLLAGSRVTYLGDVQTVERLAMSRQLIIEDTSKQGAAPGAQVVPSQVKVIIMG